MLTIDCIKCGREYEIKVSDALLFFYEEEPELSHLRTKCPYCDRSLFLFVEDPTIMTMGFGIIYDKRAPDNIRDIYQQLIDPEFTPDSPKEVKTMLKQSYRDIVAHLDSRVVGQPRALAQLERSLKIIQAGLRDIDKPAAILFFAGPTGTGKSEMVCALAEAIHGDRNAICRVDCNLLSERHAAASLSGSPPGYVGSGESDTLLNKKVIEGGNGKPGILVFEEIEKAHPMVFHTLLGIFDKGTLRLNNGKKEIYFGNTIVILTSNIGARELAKVADGRKTGFHIREDAKPQLSGEERKSIVFREMERVFAPEFINRIDDTIVFRWLDESELLVIVDKFVDELNAKLSAYPHFLKVTTAAKKYLVEKGYDLRYGARPLKRAVRKYLEDPISEVLADGIPQGSVIKATATNGGGITITVKQPPLLKP